MQVQLAANDLACRRGMRVLFAGLSIELGAGDALHIGGANGLGKSSLLRQLAGLLPAYSGTVTRAGSLALIDERLALDEHASLSDALMFWERIDRPAAPEAAYALMQLDDLLEVPVRFLSTGQRKRASFARLLNAGCDIWLLDEPLNGLDTEAQSRVEKEIERHCKHAGGICVTASHQPIALPNKQSLSLAEYVPC